MNLIEQCGDYGVCLFVQKMSSLVERLRVRSERRPVYNIDVSDDEADIAHGKSGLPSEKLERIVREDTVCEI